MQSDESPEIQINGWHFDPIDQVWTAKTGPSTWTLVHSDVNDPPHFSPEDA